MRFISRFEELERNPAVNRFLTEGVCPMRHGPLARVGKYEATCLKCDFDWMSKRIPSIFPEQDGKVEA